MGLLLRIKTFHTLLLTSWRQAGEKTSSERMLLSLVLVSLLKCLAMANAIRLVKSKTPSLYAFKKKKKNKDIWLQT